jgi:hypothetical protein
VKKQEFRKNYLQIHTFHSAPGDSLGQFTEVYIMLMESAKNSPGADFRISSEK